MKDLQKGLHKYIKLNAKIKAWLIGEIQDVRNNFEDDLDIAEKGILDGRYECAESLLDQIQKWENEELSDKNSTNEFHDLLMEIIKQVKERKEKI
jgi:hypothetical protein